MPPLPLELLVARNFDGATISRFGTGAVQLARRTKDEQVPICRDQVSPQSTSRQSSCSTDLAEPGDAQRFGTEMIGVRTSMHHLWLNSFCGNIGRHMHMHMHMQMHVHVHVRTHVNSNLFMFL